MNRFSNIKIGLAGLLFVYACRATPEDQAQDYSYQYTKVEHLNDSVDFLSGLDRAADSLDLFFPEFGHPYWLHGASRLSLVRAPQKRFFILIEHLKFSRDRKVVNDCYVYSASLDGCFHGLPSNAYRKNFFRDIVVSYESLAEYMVNYDTEFDIEKLPKLKTAGGVNMRYSEAADAYREISTSLGEPPSSAVSLRSFFYYLVENNLASFFLTQEQIGLLLPFGSKQVSSTYDWECAFLLDDNAYLNVPPSQVEAFQVLWKSYVGGKPVVFDSVNSRWRHQTSGGTLW